MRSIGLLLALIVAGCPYVGPGEYYDEIQDFDGDGVVGTRFGGDDCLDHDDSIERCDADGDGYQVPAAGGDDCDDTNPAIHPDTPFYRDADGDGYGDAADVQVSCLAPPGYVSDATDCDDTDAVVHPTAIETCDAIDRNCDGDPDAGADKSQWFVDADGDGWGDEIDDVASCSPGPGQAEKGGDCDDSDPTVNPDAEEIWYDGVSQSCSVGGSDYDQDGDGEDSSVEKADGTDCDDLRADIHPTALELCDGVDNDCDLLVDDQDSDGDQIGQLTYYLDADGDNHGGILASQWCPDAAPAGLLLVSGDCDDALSTVFPGAMEVCNSRDDDCDGAVDDSAVGAFPIYDDADGDTFGAPAASPSEVCFLPPGFVRNDDDCLDTDPDAYPGAQEVCGDAIRQDCTAFSPYDCDSDGEESQDVGGLDCDDDAPEVSSTAAEVCDGIDNDCDLLIDSADAVDPDSYRNWYDDDDGDGQGSDQLSATATCEPPPGSSADSDDCDDSLDFVYLGAPELCNDIDDDCDGAVDEQPGANAPTLYADADGDGAGDPAHTATGTCDGPAGTVWVTTGGDCNDADATRGPLAPETCDGVDNDCDGLIDAADPDSTLTAPFWYKDADGDGYGVPSDIIRSCTAPAGYVGIAGDCNDKLSLVHEGAAEICNGGLDDDCDGAADDLDGDEVGLGGSLYADDDGDGYGDPATSVSQCGPPAGYVGNFLDCDDADPSVSPAAVEVCNGGVDDDCDALADDEGPYVLGGFACYADLDGDGLGDGLPTHACVQPADSSPQPGDCDDADAAVSPFAAEICDLLDNDCDGLVDGMDPSTVGQPWFLDADADGFGGLTIALGCDLSTLGYVQASGDCNDGSDTIYPGAPEICDGADQDCNAAVDDGAVGADWLLDADGDGAPSDVVIAACIQPFGTVARGPVEDCDDDDDGAYPENPIELCDLVDNDCDGLVDAADADTFIFGAVGYLDLDGDGFGVLPGVSCVTPYVTPGYVGFPGDCAPDDPTSNPLAAEICDGLDNDCDGFPDDACDTGGEGMPGECALVTWYQDADGDGFGNPDAAEVACVAPPDYVANPFDCDDMVTGNVVEITVSTAGDLTAAVSSQVGTCKVLAIAAGAVISASVTVPTGANLSITSADPASPGTISMIGSSPAISVATGATLKLAGLALEGGTGGGELIEVDHPNAWVTLVAVTLDGTGDTAGIYVDKGTIVATGVSISDTGVVPGSAIYLNGEAAFTGYDITIHDAEGDSSVYVDPKGDDVSFTRLAVWDSARVYVAGAGDIALAEIELYRSDLDALVIDNNATVSIDRLLILDAGSDGLENLGNSTVDAAHVTIVSAGGDGVEGEDLALSDTIIHDSFGVDIRETGNVTYDSILYFDASGTPTGTSKILGVPGFLSYVVGEPAELVDLHLGAASAADDVGIAGGDLGFYLASDPWYVDADSDGLPDGWESFHIGSLVADGSADTDGDTLTNATELTKGTSPASADTDSDGSNDDVDGAPLVP